ncbi:hypothetical protein [Serratia aquatilis]|uniref:Uncharacterized protein n=1 Tax=Serratia aquatilis TaxID=1737515 RepID=A0ABV6EEN4_9GAMM
MPAFTVTLGTVGRTISMALFQQEPQVNTPLLRRATTRARRNALK